MGYSEQIPAPCRYCRTMQKHNCRMQSICTRVKAFNQREVYRRLEAQSIESHARIAKKLSHKYKGGAM